MVNIDYKMSEKIQHSDNVYFVFDIYLTLAMVLVGR